MLRSAADAIALRAFVQDHGVRQAVVIGGGLLGLEAAYSLHKMRLRVAIVERRKHLMRAQLDATAAGLFASYLRALGLEITFGASPSGVSGNGHVNGLVLDDGRQLAAGLVLVCAGIIPNVELARAAGLGVGRGIEVDDAMRTTDPAIFAAGDCVEFGGAVPGLWLTAVEQAEVAAVNAVGTEGRRYAPRLPVALLKGVGLHLLSVGVIEPADGDEAIIDPGDGKSVEYRKLVVRDGHVVGGLLLGHQSDAPALTAAVQKGLDVSESLPALRRDLGVLDDLAN